MWNNFAYTTYSVLIITAPYVHILYYAPLYPLVFLIFFILYHSMLFTFSILVLIFHVEIFCFHVCHPPQLDGFFLLYLIFNIRFNFCITMLVYLNAVRPKHRPCLSLQRKIDRFLFQQTLFVHFFLLHFLNLLLFIHVHFYYSIFLITHYMYRT